MHQFSSTHNATTAGTPQHRRLFSSLLGILGEAQKLTPDESREVAEAFITAAGSMPVIVGASAPGFQAMGQLTADVMAMGAAGVMVAPRPGLSTDRQITTYFRRACEIVGEETPLVVQDFPLNSGVQADTTVLAQIFRENENAIMLKHEDWPGLDKITELRDLTANGEMPRVSILSGFGGAFLDLEMARGADGAMTGYAFPELLVEVVSMGLIDELDVAQDLFDAHLPYIRYEQQPGLGLAVRKYVLWRRGVMSSEAQRTPVTPLSRNGRTEVDELLARLARRIGDRHAGLEAWL